jgi:hypothetical protein
MRESAPPTLFLGGVILTDNARGSYKKNPPLNQTKVEWGTLGVLVMRKCLPTPSARLMAGRDNPGHAPESSPRLTL